MRTLIVLRCGIGSLHRSWIFRTRELSDTAYLYFDDADFSSDKPTFQRKHAGTKMTGIVDFFENHPELLDQYDYFWLLEDDLFIPYDTVLRAFEFIETVRPELCAPSLTPDSFFTHSIMIQNDRLFARGTDFVEAMAPLMTSAFLKATLSQLRLFPVYGIERFWQWLLWERREVAYVLDSAPIVHTRPVGGGNLYKLAADLGLNIFKDDDDAAERFGRPFKRYRNVLFGVQLSLRPTLLFGSDLRNTLLGGASRFFQVDPENTGKFTEVLDSVNYANDLFSQYLTFGSVRRLLNVGEMSVTEAQLLVRDWSFGSTTRGQYAHRLKLAPDGRVTGYTNENERRWRLDGESVIFLSKDGQPTTRFDRWNVIDQRIVMEGRFLGAEGETHYLKERFSDDP